MNDSWRLDLHLRTVSDVLENYKKNRPLIVNISEMFNYLGNACRLLWNRSNAVHVFFNYNSAYKEIHYRIIENHYRTIEKKQNEISYKMYNGLTNHEEVKKIAELIRGTSDQYSNRYLFIKKVSILNNIKDDLLAYLLKIEIDNNLLEKSDPIVLVMDDNYLNLGCFVLYGHKKDFKKSQPCNDDTASVKIIEEWAKRFSIFLVQQVNATKETYLPSYRQTHSSQAAILFGDITNFTQLATMLRLVKSSRDEGKVELLGEILKKHCSEMSQIVKECKGRIERFIGDGLMAIFGEHKEDPVIALGNAAAAATMMVERFRSQRKDILKKIFGDVEQNEINEMIELDFSVGINYGTVLFDYLGDETHSEYSCIGDHVAFADRLMHKAARLDIDSKKVLPPILISQVAERYLRYWFGIKWESDREDAKYILHAKGYGYPSCVYGFNEKKFNIDRYHHKMMEKTERELVDELKKEYGE